MHATEKNASKETKLKKYIRRNNNIVVCDKKISTDFLHKIQSKCVEDKLGVFPYFFHYPRSCMVFL